MLAFMTNFKTEDPTELLSSAQRLAAVQRTELLDTPSEPAFDRLTELAARILGAPVAFLSLVEEHRDFYKSTYGFPEPLHSNREIEGRTFCHYAIQADGPLVLNDITEHPIFREIPTVKSLGVRAYAGVPLRNNEGHCIGAFCVVDFEPRAWPARDVEILNELAQAAYREINLRMALRELRKKAEESRYAAMARQEFLARVAHDLRNPLSAATIGIAILEYANLTTSESRALQTTRQVLESMDSIIEDLLNISQFESGKFKLTTGTVDSASLLRDAGEVLASLAQANEVALEVDAHLELPAVEADYERVLRVFSNLVGNAVKFCGPTGVVRLSAEKMENAVRFMVRDNGPGIAAENISRLFDRYWQSDDADQRGLGLGLSIVQAIVDAHKGEVGVESIIGEGATFWFTLPLAPEKRAEDPLSAELWL